MAKKKKFKIKGMKKLMRNFNTEVQGIQGRSLAGMINAVIIVQRDSYEGVPIDLSNLAHSWFSVTYKTKGNVTPDLGSFKGEEASAMRSEHQNVIQALEQFASRVGSASAPVMIYGYTANYAAWVHENNADAKFKRPKAHARWFYLSIQRKRSEMLEAIRQSARIQ